jgi:peptidyl-prolyl cis-trans isomerase B (cyclophilin B)
MVAQRAVAVATVIAALVCAGCGGGSSSTGSPPSAASCADVSTPKPRSPAKLEAPSGRLDAAKHWTLTFRTSCGLFEVRLAPQTSPRATASLVALARSGFFDGTIFHRIVPGFVIQGGDPTQSGRGGPGYTTVDTPAAGTRYAKGVVAMGKTATDPRGAAGSQFFVMTADAPSLAPDYAVVGKVVSGMGVVERIGELGDPNDPNGAPTMTVVIDKVIVGSTGP